MSKSAADTVNQIKMGKQGTKPRTSLVSQLDALRANAPVDVAVKSVDGTDRKTNRLLRQRKTHAVSFLYSEKDARDMDMQTLLEDACEALTTLSDYDATLLDLMNEDELCIFSEGYLQMERGMLTVEQNEHVNAQIKTFLSFASHYFLLDPVHKVLEYLVRHLLLHVMNKDDVLRAFLPYHESPVYVKLVGLLRYQDTQDFALVASKKVAGSKHMLAKLMLKQTHVLDLVCDIGCQEHHKQASNFFVAMLTAMLGMAPRLEEQVLRTILPYVFKALRSNEKNLRSAGVILATMITSHCTLTPTASTALLQLLLQKPCGHAETSCLESILMGRTTPLEEAVLDLLFPSLALEYVLKHGSLALSLVRLAMTASHASGFEFTIAVLKQGTDLAEPYRTEVRNAVDQALETAPISFKSRATPLLPVKMDIEETEVSEIDQLSTIVAQSSVRWEDVAPYSIKVLLEFVHTRLPSLSSDQKQAFWRIAVQHMIPRAKQVLTKEDETRKTLFTVIMEHTPVPLMRDDMLLMLNALCSVIDEDETNVVASHCATAFSSLSAAVDAILADYAHLTPHALLFAFDIARALHASGQASTAPVQRQRILFGALTLHEASIRQSAFDALVSDPSRSTSKAKTMESILAQLASKRPEIVADAKQVTAFLQTLNQRQSDTFIDLMLQPYDPLVSALALSCLGNASKAAKERALEFIPACDAVPEFQAQLLEALVPLLPRSRLQTTALSLFESDTSRFSLIQRHSSLGLCPLKTLLDRVNETDDTLLVEHLRAAFPTWTHISTQELIRFLHSYKNKALVLELLFLVPVSDSILDLVPDLAQLIHSDDIELHDGAVDLLLRITRYGRAKELFSLPSFEWNTALVSRLAQLPGRAGTVALELMQVAAGYAISCHNVVEGLLPHLNSWTVRAESDAAGRSNLEALWSCLVSASSKEHVHALVEALVACSGTDVVLQLWDSLVPVMDQDLLAHAIALVIPSSASFAHNMLTRCSITAQFQCLLTLCQRSESASNASPSTKRKQNPTFASVVFQTALSFLLEHAESAELDTSLQSQTDLQLVLGSLFNILSTHVHDKRPVRQLVEQCMDCLLHLLSHRQFFQSIAPLLSSDTPSARQGLRILHRKLEAVPNYQDVVPESGAVFKALRQLLVVEQQESGIVASALRSLATVARNWQPTFGAYIVKGIVSDLTHCIHLIDDEQRICTPLLDALAAYAPIFGLQFLPAALPSVDAAIAALQRPDALHAHHAAYSLIESLLTTLPKFLRPRLTPLLTTLLHAAAQAEDQEKMVASNVLVQLAEELPASLLLQPALECYTSLDAKSHDALLGLLAVVVRKLDAEELGDVCEQVHAFLSTAMLDAIRADTSVHPVCAAYTQFALRLSEMQLRSLLLWSLQWLGAEWSNATAEDYLRASSVFCMIEHLASVLESLFVPYFSYFLEHAYTLLITRKNGPLAPERFRMTRYIVKALHTCFRFDEKRDFLQRRVAEKLGTRVLEYIAGIAAHQDEGVFVSRELVPAFVQLLYTVNKEDEWKPLVRGIVGMMKHKKYSSVRHVALDILEQCAVKIHTPFLATLPDIVPALAEAMDDSDETVEKRARTVIYAFEKLSGKSLQDYFR